MKRILTIQDISCIGRCSLTTALPIISSMGIETAVIPTAILSTHTAFKNYTFRDLTQDILPITKHWKNEKIEFDGIYTGYLGSYEQLTIVEQIFDEFKTNSTLIFVDPVMADFGKLYPGFTLDFVDSMKNLCAKADVLTPNLTEACLLTNSKYIQSGYDKNYIKEILQKLSNLGAKKVILTGVSFNNNSVGAMSYDSITNLFFEYHNEKLGESFHGTGDIFASTLFAGLTNGYKMETALEIAIKFTTDTIRKTLTDETLRWYGVSFERSLPYLMNLVNEQNK